MDIRPAFAKRNIPVVFATDANYLPYLAVAINSLVANTTSGNLDVLVLHAGIEEEARAEFLNGFAGRPCLSLRFVDVTSRAAGSALSGFVQGRYHTVAACYRLFIPELLPDYDRVIYLDVDTIVCHDIGELLSVDIGGNLFAAARDIVNSCGNPEYRQWGRSYGFEEWSEYVNSGVVLFNLQEFRKANLLETLLKIAVEASKKWFCDQDALNFVCKGRIARLDPRWNVQVGAYCLKEQLAITKDEAFVIHYTDSQKPWGCPTHPYAHLWWRHVDASVLPCLWRRALGNVIVPSVGETPRVSLMDVARPEIKPAFAERNVPISVATDENYLPYLKVAVRSILANTKKGNIDFLVLNDGIGADAQHAFIGSFTGVSNLSIRFIDVGDAVRSLNVDKYKQSSQTHFTIAILYRLLLPYLLTSYEKMLYLDIDLCVCGDVADLYNTDIGDCLLGGVYDLGVKDSVAFRAGYSEWGRANGFCEWEDYINSGVIIVNLEAFRAENGIFDRLLLIAIAGADHFPDQDALNFVCKGRIRHLDLEWNLMTPPNCLKNWQGKIGGNPKIFHYCGHGKPWAKPQVMYAHLWWRYVSYEEGRSLWRKAFGDRPQVAIGEGVAASVIIPIYNARPYLAQALTSYCSQTLRNIEIICVDDGSTDGSLAVCEKFASADPRIKVVSQKNQGAAVARNHGIKEAKGRWLFFGDADDFCTPEMLEEMVAEGERKAAEIVAAGWHVINMQTGCTWQQKLPAKYFKVDGKKNCHTDGIDVFNAMNLPVWDKLFKADFVRANRLEFHQISACDDYFFVAAAMIKADAIAFLPAAYYFYRADNPASQLGAGQKNAVEYPRNLLRAFLDVKPLLEREDECLQSKFYAACVANFFKCIFNIRETQVKIATFDLLQNGGLMELAFPAMNVAKADLGEWRRPFDMILAGCDIFELTIERGRSLVERKMQELAKRDKRLLSAKKKYEREIRSLKSSTAYRVGMFATWPARKAWGGVKCLRENGIKYTAKHFVGKLARAFGFRTVKW